MLFIGVGSRSLLVFDLLFLSSTIVISVVSGNAFDEDYKDKNGDDYQLDYERDDQNVCDGLYCDNNKCTIYPSFGGHYVQALCDTCNENNFFPCQESRPVCGITFNMNSYVKRYKSFE